jgi:hypothetical protein
MPELSFEDKVDEVLAGQSPEDRQRSLVDSYLNFRAIGVAWQGLHNNMNTTSGGITQMWAIFMGVAALVLVSAAGIPAYAYIALMTAACGITGHFVSKVLDPDIEGMPDVDPETAAINMIRITSGGATLEDVLALSTDNKKKEQIFRKKVAGNRANILCTRIISVLLPLGAMVVMMLEHPPW